MSSFTCDHGTAYALFGEGGGERLAAEIGVPLVGTVPLHPDMAASGDAGTPVALGIGPLAVAFDALAGASSRTSPPWWKRRLHGPPARSHAQGNRRRRSCLSPLPQGAGRLRPSMSTLRTASPTSAELSERDAAASTAPTASS